MSVLDAQPPRRDGWARTQWSVLASLDRKDDPAWESSWEYLVDAYRLPMERYVRCLLSRIWNRSATSDEAAEVVSDFLAMCLEKTWLSRADSERGRFRAYVQTLLKRFTHGAIRHATAQRRHPGPGRQVFSLLDIDVVEDLTVEEQLEIDEFTEG